ncbi:YbaN family protein [Novosphingobium sp. 1949]|uniref:YbaN family protein n=1 Tax=Novosphingobium organovorum TaxID=2930092 RepID=A0ABT0BFI4_9SPHN|nr:YbaN family protein [Novosphingobium organovorum]MCJ2183814.1 YbaN family protein [Novosphingobium organovorum]
MKRVKRSIWLIGGLLGVALGTIGIFLPVMPTVVFYLLAAWCFSKSHPEWAERLYNHPKHGEHLRAWRDRRAISRKGKIAAITAMTCSVPFTWLVAGFPIAFIPLGVLAVIGPWIWTRAE